MEIAVDLYALVQAAGDAIIVADVEGRIVLWNPAVERLFGFTATEAVGSLLDLIISARFRERHWRGYQTVMQTGQTRYGSQVLRVPALRKDGQRVSIAFTVALLHTPAGGLTGRVMRPGGRWRCPADQRACHLSAVLGSPRCEAWAPRKSDLRPLTGFVRTSGCRTGGYTARSSAVKNPGRTWSRDHAKSWTATARSTRRFSASGSDGYAARALAKSVAPPSGGTIRADSSEQSEGTGLNDESLCQSWLPL